MMVQNFVRTINAENHLNIFWNSENWGDSYNLPQKLKSMILKKQVRTAHHWLKQPPNTCLIHAIWDFFINC
jgi:hypothetical protein